MYRVSLVVLTVTKPENISAIHYVEPDEAPVVVVLEAVEVKVVLYYGSFNHLGFMWPGELCL